MLVNKNIFFWGKMSPASWYTHGKGRLVPHLVILYSGKFSWGKNFRDFRDRIPSRENLFLQKSSSLKIFAFLLAWKFITNSYPHALINVLAFCDRLKQCKLDFLGKIAIFMREIVGGVVINHDLVAKLKIAKIFSWRVSWWFAKISCYTVIHYQ